ncbi:MAG: hypothetical protein HYZ52_00595 [Candidatus Omnitrophica bacterium]|nr:hypothetical protein [Candidatus Omnitrophota bacterium]
MTRRVSAIYFLPLVLAAGFLCFFLDQKINASAAPAGFENIPGRILGSAGEAVGDTLFLKADAYFHGGETFPNRPPETKEELGREGFVEDERENEKTLPAQPAGDWISRVNHEVRRHGHYHLTKDKQKEMLPFFAAAVKLDPRNVPAILTAAFWLDKSFDRSDAAIEILKQGARDNPEAWEIDAALADIYFYRKKDYARGEFHYADALRKAKSGDLTRFRRIDLTYHLAESLNFEGKRALALEAYREAFSLYDVENQTPLKETIRGKIQSLVVGE